MIRVIWKWAIPLFAGLLMSFGLLQEQQTVIYLIGDSTCAEKEVNAYPETGWGMPFVHFFDESIKVDNRAKNGRSTKSFMDEGRWEAVLKMLNSGDYVFIQFGHNDEVPSKVGRYTTPEEFQANLRGYVIDTRKKGALPVLLTPVSRRSFENGELVDTHEHYAQLVREVAQSNDVPLIDMTTLSMELVRNLGETESKWLYHHLDAGEHPNYPQGKSDDTHFNELGARKMAQLVLDGIRELNLELKNHIVAGTR
ncbi:rhamnogalacturonan acetylesterase [Marinoscillum sp. 108]|uniref:rhamnogalacturonan acetylesterase n=1 Tax=Marinoscillum sp. 108 TaxID=2653151 RepID=UPI0012F46A21|nr:rhamnogalacturonan acetylesterase [Marinoscillum sp. 108]VXD21258.1 Rhamnogalacturonan acetylesterase RhgT [Marinoscillum sp. 108]